MKGLKKIIISCFCTFSLIFSVSCLNAQVKEIGIIDYIDYYDWEVYEVKAIDNIEQGTRTLIFESSLPESKGRFILIDKLSKEGGFYNALKSYISISASNTDIDINIFSSVEGAYYQKNPSNQELVECEVKFFYHKEKALDIPIFRMDITPYNSTMGMAYSFPASVFLLRGTQRAENMIVQLD